MKVLWIVNVLFPQMSKHIEIAPGAIGGGWMFSLAEDMKNVEEVELAVVTVANVSSLTKISEDGITFYLLPGGSKVLNSPPSESYKRDCYSVIESFNPDIVHLHGTEFAHGLGFIETFKGPKVVSIQGLINSCIRHFDGGVNWFKMALTPGIKNQLKALPILAQKNQFHKRTKSEIEILQSVNNIIGRTDWDKSNISAINPKATYYKCYESLRSTFYNTEWDINSIERHTIFMGNSGTPLKGLHTLIEAVGLLKSDYMDIKVFAAGRKQTPSSWRDWKRNIGYALYLQELIKKYDLTNNIIFTGFLSEKEMAEMYKKTHTFVLPSYIENGSNALGEAMLVGTPCVAAYSGGVPSMARNGSELLFYPVTEPEMLAESIKTIWENDSLAMTLSEHGKKRSILSHDKISNLLKMLDIYSEIINKFDK